MRPCATLLPRDHRHPRPAAPGGQPASQHPARNPRGHLLAAETPTPKNQTFTFSYPLISVLRRLEQDFINVNNKLMSDPQAAGCDLD